MAPLRRRLCLGVGFSETYVGGPNLPSDGQAFYAGDVTDLKKYPLSSTADRPFWRACNTPNLDPSSD